MKEVVKATMSGEAKPNPANTGFGPNEWLVDEIYQQYLNKPLSHIMGCLEEEVTVMNALTVNLHLFLLSFSCLFFPTGFFNNNKS